MANVNDTAECTTDFDCEGNLFCYNEKIPWNDGPTYCDCDFFNGFTGEDCSTPNQTGVLTITCCVIGAMVLVATSLVWCCKATNKLRIAKDFKRVKSKWRGLFYATVFNTILIYVFLALTLYKYFDPSSIGDIALKRNGAVTKFNPLADLELAFSFYCTVTVCMVGTFTIADMLFRETIDTLHGESIMSSCSTEVEKICVLLMYLNLAVMNMVIAGITTYSFFSVDQEVSFGIVVFLASLCSIFTCILALIFDRHSKSKGHTIDGLFRRIVIAFMCTIFFGGALLGGGSYYNYQVDELGWKQISPKDEISELALVADLFFAIICLLHVCTCKYWYDRIVDEGDQSSLNADSEMKTSATSETLVAGKSTL